MSKQSSTVEDGQILTSSSEEVEWKHHSAQDLLSTSTCARSCSACLHRAHHPLFAHDIEMGHGNSNKLYVTHAEHSGMFGQHTASSGGFKAYVQHMQ